MATAFITHPACRKHAMQPGHPESPARLDAINDQLIASGVMDFLSCHEAPKASKEELTRAHSSTHVDWIFDQAPESDMRYLDPDTAMNPYSLEAALHAAGAVVLAVDLVMAGTVSNAFCSIRPPGHHAGRHSAAGFCIFNNIAVGVAHALSEHKIKRAAILDFDVHHGNGTEDIFHGDDRVMLCSSFRHPYYPFRGADSGNAHIINTPLPAGGSGEQFRAVVTDVWLPALEKFKPEFVFNSAGFDAHKDDDMGGLKLNDDDYLWITGFAKDIAKRFANDRIVSALEGGYHLPSLGRCVALHVKSLTGI
jgi:acetoin utilization deacetylase AcuC-like enzyme